jgi:hypothetical protein
MSTGDDKMKKKSEKNGRDWSVGVNQRMWEERSEKPKVFKEVRHAAYSGHLLSRGTVVQLLWFHGFQDYE